MHSHSLMNDRRFWERSNVNHASEWVLVDDDQRIYTYTAKMLDDLMKNHIEHIITDQDNFGRGRVCHEINDQTYVVDSDQQFITPVTNEWVHVNEAFWNEGAMPY
jgi:hypothetical protein